MTKWDARGLFEDDVKFYDSTVEWVVPYYKKMHELMVKLAVESSSFVEKTQGLSMRALDIGSGTGAEAIALLQAITDLQLVGVDISEAMNKVFALRAANADVSADRFRLIQADILDPTMQVEIPSKAFEAFGAEKFHIITSAFTLHHFARDQKIALFRLIYNLLEPGGVFLLGDLFNYDGESAWLTDTIAKWETQWFVNNFDQGAAIAADSSDSCAGEALKELKDKWLRHYLEEHALDSVTSQLTILKSVGFQAAGNPFRYWQVGLIYAQKGAMA